MSTMGDAMSAAIKRRLEKAEAPTDAAKLEQARLAKKALGYGKEQPEKGD